MKIPIFQIKINDGRRETDPEAAKRLGWPEIECNVSSLEGLQAELAEIDENFVRKGLSEIEYGDLLLKRKELYESLHPEARHGGDRKSDEIKRPKWPLDSEKSFVDDVAEKTGKGKRTIRRQIQIAKNLTPEAKEVLRGAGNHITQKDTLAVSQIEPEHQETAAKQLIERKSFSLDKSRCGPAELAIAEEQPQETPPEPPVPSKAPEPAPAPEDRCPSIQELAADLKNPDKDRRCTPDSFLVTFSYFLQRFCQSMENYTGPEYDAVLPVLTREHLNQIHQKVQFVHAALDEMYHKMERMAQNEST